MSNFNHTELRSELEKLAKRFEFEHSELSDTLKLLIDADEFEDLNPYGLKAIIKILENSDKHDLAEIYKLLFAPAIPEVSDIEIFRKQHEIIHEKLIEEAIEHLELHEVGIISLDTGMYSGKSTLAHRISEKLLNKGIKSFRIVPSEMNEPHIDLRGIKGENSNQQISAKGLSYDNVDELLNEILEEGGDKKVVHFDEYTFTYPELAEKVVKELVEKGISVILAGLKADFLGRTLPTYEKVRQYRPELIKSIVCNSFVKEFDMYELKPSGTMTRRFIQLANGFVFSDLGFGEVLIPKHVQGVIYLPITEEHHPISLVKKYDIDLAERILNPDLEVQRYQKNLTKKLMGQI